MFTVLFAGNVVCSSSHLRMALLSAPVGVYVSILVIRNFPSPSDAAVKLLKVAKLTPFRRKFKVACGLPPALVQLHDWL